MLLIATIIHQRANEPSAFTASSQSHKSALIAVPLWNKLPATFRSALMPGTVSLIPLSAISTVINHCGTSLNNGWKLHHISLTTTSDTMREMTAQKWKQPDWENKGDKFHELL